MESRIEFVQPISLEEMVIINGGSVESDAYDAGYAAGKFVQKVIAGVGILIFFWTL
jgi:hypothetical protein